LPRVWFNRSDNPGRSAEFVGDACLRRLAARNVGRGAPTTEALLADILFDKAICPDAAIPTFDFDGLRFLVEDPVNNLDRLNSINSEYSLGGIISPLGATATLPAMNIPLAVITNRNLVHIDKTRQTTFADVTLINDLDYSVCFSRVAERGFVFRIRFGRRKRCHTDKQNNC
jgi:hypothetical protein